jgi:hypothetical protein
LYLEILMQLLLVQEPFINFQEHQLLLAEHRVLMLHYLQQAEPAAAVRAQAVSAAGVMQIALEGLAGLTPAILTVAAAEQLATLLMAVQGAMGQQVAHTSAATAATPAT